MLIGSQRDMEVVGEAGSHEELLRRAREVQPDVVTLDLSMPGGSGAKAIETLCRELPAARVLVLTMHDDPAYFRMAMAAGAVGYVVKSAADSELLDAIRSVAKGQVYTRVKLPVGARDDVQPAAPGRRGVAPLESLSSREQEVLVLVAEGHTNQAIADRMLLSVKTVESYRSRLMAKLGLRTRAELTQLAVELGLLQPKSGPAAPDH
jgi:DNA-binding NarL/FixJ family response regulator